MTEQYFTCTCKEMDHTLRFVFDPDKQKDGEEYKANPTIYTEIRMVAYKPWYKRILLAINYVLGLDTRHHYSCSEINQLSDDPDRMITMLSELNNVIERSKFSRDRKYPKKING